MMKFILGKKIGMSQIFDEKGRVVPVTLVEAGPCKVAQIKTKEKDSYSAVQLAFQELKAKKVKKTQNGKPFRYLKEYRLVNEDCALNTGDSIDVSVFEVGDIVKVAGLTKGKGFQGAVKRHGFAGRASATHGQKHELRTIGSVGCSNPDHVIKGKKMPGRMGFERVTVRNAKIVKIDKDKNIIAIRGAVPGGKGTFVEIKGKKTA
ncbi:MAG TPA: 50S ribosomal protein L3 [Candidatus Paceibacterota bacterium]|nr:50S ribosomal protein L3 [Candidatus Pacearchaeota archaeon]HRZ50948.1 50S ribosomal protein L3 [Candidatus Paceibacterota bacterium]HSA36669.1 50S ribosomal protein L3 [Candidatus Paceibacterota bacterium]